MGRFHFVLGLCLSSALALAPTPGLAQGTSSLTGTVFSEPGNRRIENATVMLCDEQGNRLLEVSTNNAGEFALIGVHLQVYVLKVSAEGFAPTELRVDLSTESSHGFSVGLRALAAGSGVPDRATISVHELSMPEAARDLVSSGRKKLYTEKSAQAALADFQAAAAKAPDYYEAYYHAGMAYLTLQNEAAAEKQFRRAVEVSDRKYGDADIALGTLLLKREEGGEGEKYLRQGLALNPQSWPGQVELGKLELTRGHVDAALAAGDIAESLAPGQPMVYRLLALVHMKQKNYTALLADLDSYIRLDPNSPAGLRAKQLRAEVGKEVPQSNAAATASAAK